MAAVAELAATACADLERRGAWPGRTQWLALLTALNSNFCRKVPTGCKWESVRRLIHVEVVGRGCHSTSIRPARKRNRHPTHGVLPQRRGDIFHMNFVGGGDLGTLIVGLHVAAKGRVLGVVARHLRSASGAMPPPPSPFRVPKLRVCGISAGQRGPVGRLVQTLVPSGPADGLERRWSLLMIILLPVGERS